MKREVLAVTENVIKTRKMLEDLYRRPFTEMTGLALVYGPPGLGKTRTMQKLAFQQGFVQVKLDASTTQKSFIIKLREVLSYKLNLNLPYPRGSSDSIFNECLDYLNNTQLTIVVDEIDYAFGDKKLLGTIRDIVDDAIFTNVILVGMADAKNRLEKANSHYFDRCNYFVHFQPLSYEDTTKVCNELCDFAVPEKVCKKIFHLTKGTPRKIVKEIQALEVVQNSKGK